MLHVRIRIDGREYFIPSEQDAEAITEKITAQVRAGGGFVEILRAAERTVSVLVSPGMNLVLEKTVVEDLPDDSDDLGERWPTQSWIDAFDVS